MTLWNLFSKNKHIGTADAATKAEAQNGATLYAGHGKHIDADLCRGGNCQAPGGGKNGKPLKHENGKSAG